MNERETQNPDPRCPKCGYTMCELADERQVTPLATIATPNGQYQCYHCTPIQKSAPAPTPLPTTEREQGRLFAVRGRLVRVSMMPDGVTCCRDAHGRVAVRDVTTNRLSYVQERDLSAPPAPLPTEREQGNYYGESLTAKVQDGRLVIAVGVETLAHAVAYADWSNPFDDAADEYIRTFAIADAPQFAKDMVSAMLAEREDGSTPLSEFLDRMARAAIEDGSLGLDEAEHRIKHGDHAPCETWAHPSTPTPGAPR